MYASSEDSCDSAHLRRLTWTFAARQCDKYCMDWISRTHSDAFQNLGCWRSWVSDVRLKVDISAFFIIILFCLFCFVYSNTAYSSSKVAVINRTCQVCSQESFAKKEKIKLIRNQIASSHEHVELSPPLNVQKFLWIFSYKCTHGLIVRQCIGIHADPQTQSGLTLSFLTLEINFNIINMKKAHFLCLRTNWGDK